MGRRNSRCQTLPGYRTGLLRLPLLALLVSATPTMAQVTPADGHTQVVFENNLFSIQGGILSEQGTNLFHQFDQFWLGPGQGVNFETPQNLQNVIAFTDNAAYINGFLSLTGSQASLYLLSPAGILFGPQAQLNLPASFTAATASRVEFEQGWLTPTAPELAQFEGIPQRFGLDNMTASVVNLGDLAVSEGHAITLLGGTVLNRGSITAPAGSITLAAIANGSVQITSAGQILSLEVDPNSAPSENWRLSASALPAWLTGGDIDHALQLAQDPTGATLITGSQLTLGPGSGTAVVTGEITTASTSSRGGTVQVLGQQVALVEATLRADGAAGGGAVYVGGDHRGEGSTPTAAVTFVGPASRLLANATSQGDGGEVVVWADGLTQFSGQVQAQGGAIGGNGGFAEISSREYLHFDGSIDLSAATGVAGVLLLDPRDIVITNNIGPETNNLLLPQVLAGSNPGETFYIHKSALEAASVSAVILEATNDIIVTSDIGLLNLAGLGSVQFIADSDGVGGGRFLSLGTTIRAAGRDLSIMAAEIAAGDLQTAVTAFNNSAPGGSVTLTALSGGIQTGDIQTYSQASNNGAAAGGSVMVSALGGSVTTGNIQTYSRAGNNNSSAGGNVSISATGSLQTGSIQTDSQAGNNNARSGGSVLLASGGNLQTGDVQTFAQARNNAGAGGAVTAIATGNLTAETVQTSARAIDTVGPGGHVSLLANGSLRIGTVSTESTATAGNIRMESLQAVLVTGVFLASDGLQASLSSVGGGQGGQIEVVSGSGTFDIGGATLSGTAAAITRGVDQLVPAQTLTETTVVGNIRIQLTGESLVARSGGTESEPERSALAHSTPDQLLPAEPAIAPPESATREGREAMMPTEFSISGDLSSPAAQLSELENSFIDQFQRQLALSETLPQAADLRSVQHSLRAVTAEVGVTPALVYLYFEADALEILVVTGQGDPVRHKTGFSQAEVIQLGHDFRWSVSNPTLLPSEYLPSAQALYQALIAPVEMLLAQRQIDSLGFVLDSGLRSLPLAALHDGQQFLVERYALGVLPAYSLTQFDGSSSRRKTGEHAVLAMGISEFADQQALPAVPVELALIAESASDRAYLNAESTVAQLQTALQQQPFDVVHLATHAVFEPGSVEQAYVQLWDQRLGFDQLRSLNLQQANVGLLVLSACKTAIGDEAAEFGFAGLAVKTGTPSVLASLWAVSDEGTLGLMVEFYRQLQGSARATALQQAQLNLLRGQTVVNQGTLSDPRGSAIATLPELGGGSWDFTHPVYWSSFTLIGNPW